MRIPQVKVPSFTMTLPVSKEQIDFRPFLVKEEKIMLLAKDSKDPKDIARVIGDVVESCTFGKVLMNKHCLADLQYAFLHIRGKSIGEEIELNLLCGNCNAKTPYKLTVNDFQVSNLEISNTIQMGGVTVAMTPPTINHYTRMYQVENVDEIFFVMAECIDKIYSDEEVFQNTPEFQDEIFDFLNGLPSDEFNKIQEYFKNIPLLYKDMKFTCNSCDTPNNVRVDSLNNFF